MIKSDRIFRSHQGSLLSVIIYFFSAAFLLSILESSTSARTRVKEFTAHKHYEKKTKVKVYFCDPYSSYQRGTNENRIGLLRQYFPKKTDLTKITNKQLEMIEFELNNRPMKILD